MTDINAHEDLWATRLRPEGILERWLAANDSAVATGHPIALVRIEDAVHEIIAPCPGRLARIAKDGALIEPGSLLGQIND